MVQAYSFSDTADIAFAECAGELTVMARLIV
jgi:hypothetical protein